MRAQINAGKLDELDKVPLLQRLIQYRYPTSGELMPDRDIISEAMGHMYVPIFSSLVSHADDYTCCKLVFTSCCFISLRNGCTTLGSVGPIRHLRRCRISSGSSAASRTS